MADVLAGIKSLSFNAAAVSNAESYQCADLSGMVAEATVRAGELLRTIYALIAALPAGDTNLNTLNGFVTTLLTVGQFNFNIPAQSGLIAQINMG